MQRDEPAPGGFPATRPSILERIRDDDPEARREAFGDLVEGYWKPVYKHLRLTWRADADEALRPDAGVLRRRLPEVLARTLRAVEGALPDLRPRLRRSLRHESAPGGDAPEARRRRPDGPARLRRRRTRGGRGPETAPPIPTSVFTRSSSAPSSTRRCRICAPSTTRQDARHAFTLFERYDLAPEAGASYAALAAEYGLTTSQVTNALAQVRRRFRERALASLRGLCGSEQEFRREARELFGIDVD